MIISNIYTSVAYYIHERLWSRTDWGKTNPTPNFDMANVSPKT